MFRTKGLLKLFAMIFVGFGVTGCATKMPLSPDGPVTMQADEGLAFFTMTLKNEFKNYLLTPDVIFVEASADNSGKTHKFSFGEPEQKVSDRELKVVGSFALPPGDYEITYFTGQTDVGFALLPVVGRFEPPFKGHFRLSAGEAVYLGHVLARLVEKTSGDENRAGPILPLLDQATTGMSSGTFKFEILDRYSEDVQYVRTRFPSVANRSFIKRLMMVSADAGSSVLAEAKDSQVGNSESHQPIKASSRLTEAASLDVGECSVTQILEMKKLGLSDAQIKKSCS